MVSKTEKEIFDLIKKGLQPKQIAFRRKTSLQATYKILKKLKEKGLISGSSYKGFKTQTTLTPSTKKIIGLHGQEFNLQLKFKDNNYQKSQKSMYFHGNKIRLYKNSLEIYSKQSFYGRSTWEANIKSKIYFKKFFYKLSDKLGIIIKSVKQVNSHYAEEDNEIARDNKIKRKKLQIKGEDGKIWAKTDFSLNENEFETIHPKTSEDDINKVVDYFNDIRDKFHYKPSELTELLTRIGLNQQMFNDNLVKHMKVLDDMKLTLKIIRKQFENKKNIKDLFLNCHSFNRLSKEDKDKIIKNLENDILPNKSR